MRPMIMRSERRQSYRMAVEGLAYVNLQPNSGGVVLNISEGGMCFHSSAPVEHPSNIRFWFAQGYPKHDGSSALADEGQNKRGAQFIEAECVLAWTDEQRRTGGLRFTSMSDEGREHIRQWIQIHELQSKTGVKPTFSPGPPLTGRAPRTSLLQSGSAEKSIEGSESGTQVATEPANIPPVRRTLGFVGGLLAGVAASALLVGVFLLGAHSRDVGQSLIRVGQQVEGSAPSGIAKTKSQSGTPQTLDVASLPPANLPASAVDAQRQPSTSAVGEDNLPPAHDPSSQIRKLSAKRRPHSPHATLTLPQPPVLDSSSEAIASALSEPESPARPTVHMESSTDSKGISASEKFLEVGSFKDRAWIGKTTDKLALMGFHTAVVPKGGLWKKSYRVLVGPYSTDQEAETAHKYLVARGFTPRSFERGTRDFTFRTPLKLNGTHVPVGQCVVSWESYMPDAIVKFEDYRGMSMTAEGKWVNRGIRYEHDAIVYQIRPDGSKTLLELQFYGKGQALVFDRENTPVQAAKR